MEWRAKDPNHVTWVQALKDLLAGLKVRTGPGPVAGHALGPAWGWAWGSTERAAAGAADGAGQGEDAEPQRMWLLFCVASAQRSTRPSALCLQAFCARHFPAGPAWNAGGIPASDFKPGAGPAAPAAAKPAAAPAPPPKAPGGPPPPPPPPPPGALLAERKPAAAAANSGSSGGGNPMAALFADINKGTSVTSGLRKVTGEGVPRAAASYQVPAQGTATTMGACAEAGCREPWLGGSPGLVASILTVTFCLACSLCLALPGMLPLPGALKTT